MNVLLASLLLTLNRYFSTRISFTITMKVNFKKIFERFLFSFYKVIYSFCYLMKGYTFLRSFEITKRVTKRIEKCSRNQPTNFGNFFKIFCCFGFDSILKWTSSLIFSVFPIIVNSVFALIF